MLLQMDPTALKRSAMDLWRSISAVERPPTLGIKIWLRHWLSSQFIVLLFTALGAVIPSWSITYGDRWLWLFDSFGSFSDSRMDLYIYPLAFYLALFIVISIWNFLDVKNITLLQTMDSAADVISYRLGLTALGMFAFFATLEHISIFSYVKEATDFASFDPTIREPAWLVWGSIAFEILFVGCAIYRAARNFIYFKDRWAAARTQKRNLV